MDPNGDETSPDSGKELETSLFSTIGTGIVDRDGEDVGSRGRILLFEIKRTTASLDDTGAYNPQPQSFQNKLRLRDYPARKIKKLRRRCQSARDGKAVNFDNPPVSREFFEGTGR